LIFTLSFIIVYSVLCNDRFHFSIGSYCAEISEVKYFATNVASQIRGLTMTHAPEFSSSCLAMFLAPAATTTRMMTLHPVDYAIIVIYFLMVLGIGFYLKRYTQRGEDFFLAGREMTAWVAGLSFVSANLGTLELMGWAGSAYQYGILAAHFYWIGAIPAMLFLGIVMMPFYYISKTHSVPGYLQLRYGNSTSALSAASFALMTLLMSGVNMFAM